MMSQRALALIAAFFATLIYSVNYTIAKDVMPLYVKPFAFIIFRVGGALLLFTMASFFVKPEKIDREDYKLIFFTAIFGSALNMLSFFKGLSLTTPINASVIMTMVPIIVFIMTLIFFKEKLVYRKLLGVVIGFIGALILIVYGNSTSQNAENAFVGNLFVFGNALLYSVYILLVKKLLQKYNPFTFVKWLYLIGFFIVLPFGYSEFTEINWSVLPSDIILKILYVIVFTTFLTYLFNLLALSKLKPTTVSSFIYVQPVLTSIFAMITKSDSLSVVKIIAALIILSGVYLVSKPVVIEGESRS